MKTNITAKSVSLFLCLFLFIGTVFAQINISIQNQTIKQIIPQIEKASGYSIFYINELPDLNVVKSLTFTNSSITDILSQLFYGTNISFQIKADKQILLILKSKVNKSSVDTKKKINGKVVDRNGVPLIGVYIQVDGENVGTISDTEGVFAIEVPESSVLSFSYLGYATKKVVVGEKEIVDIVLEEDLKNLDEVVVIGYGTVKKKDLTGAVSSVKGSDIIERRTAQLSNALQGSTSGLMVLRNNGAPGSAASSIRVRGITTIGNSDPLVIVDGVPGDINQVNAIDVENISVLKDAASAAIYGSRAASGVILVSTKRATESDLSLTYVGEFGIEIPTLQPQSVGVQRYLEMTNELRFNDNPSGGHYQTYSEDQINNWLTYHVTEPNIYPVTNWQNMILKSSAERKTHTLHICGGSKGVRTKASLSYDNINGLYADRKYQRYTLRVNNDFTISKMLGATLDLNVKRSMYHMPLYDPFASMRLIPAVYAAVWSDGRIAEGKSGGNPYGLMLLGGSVDNTYTQVGGKGSIEFRPFKEFKISGVLAPIFNYNKFKSFKKKAFYTLAGDPNVIGGYLEDNASPYSTTRLNEGRNDDYNITAQVIANYMKSFGSHDVNLMGGYENYYQFSETLFALRDGYILPYEYLDNGPETLRDNGGNANEYAYRSWFGRFMYGYANRYLFQANIRSDGSSRFAEGHRWGIFPSFSAAWVVSEERFLKAAHNDWLSFLKFRTSWGALGNERIGNFPYMSTIEFGNSLFYKDGAVVSATTAAQKKYTVENISWEKTESTDIGFDAAILKNKLSVTGDYYWKNTKDMLLALNIPDFLGLNDPEVNAGKMSTKGYEIDLNWNDKIGDWRYKISINFSDFISRMGNLKGTQFIADKVKKEGSEFDEWYGYLSDGLFLTELDVATSPKINNNTKVGDIKYKDISGPNGIPDGVISPEYDRTLLGGSLPRNMFGGNIFVAYKKLDISVTFQGVGKQNVRLERDMIEPLRGNYGNIPTILDGNYWSSFNSAAQNAVAKYPRLTRVTVESNMAMSDYWLFNGRYFRLKNLTMGYTFSEYLTRKVGVGKLRLYVTASDLFCISNYPKGWDPEMGTSSYPITTSIVFGASLTF